MMNLIFLPLMKNDIPKDELAVKSIKLAQTIEDTTKRNACIAAVFAFGSKYLDENQLERLAEVLRMTDLAVMFKQEGKQEERFEIAKRLIRRGLSIEAITEDTGLEESTIKELQEEMISATN